MRNKNKEKADKLARLRNEAYKIFLSGHGNNGLSFDRNNPIECRCAALMMALNGNFPDAFRLFNCHLPKKRKRFFLRLIASARVALLPHEAEQSKNLDDFGFLLWRDYLDAARWFISRNGISDRAYYSIRLYQKTGLPSDLAAARSSVRKKREFADLLPEAEQLAQLTKEADDIAFVRKLVDDLMPIKRIERLLKLYDSFGDQADLDAAIIAAETANAKEVDFLWSSLPNDRINCWKKIWRVTHSARAREGLAKAKELQRLFKQKNEAEKQKGKERIFADAKCCINVASNDGNVEYLTRALELIESISGPERLRLLIQLTDIVDESLDKPYRWIP
jgi:hypothetical protein